MEVATRKRCISSTTDDPDELAAPDGKIAAFGGSNDDNIAAEDGDDDALLEIPEDLFDPKSLMARFGHLFSREDLSHCAFYEELRFFEFFVDQRSAQWHGLRSRISKDYPTSVKRMTGSILSALVGLSRKSALPYDIWRAWTNRLREGESTAIEPNDDMEYGTMYEPRIRRILITLLGVHIKEPGFYVDLDRPWFGVSPDGITEPLRMVVSFGGRLPEQISMGRTIIEIKASARLLRDVPQVEHLVQMHEEMYIPRCQWGWLAYWHCDSMRIWLVKYQPSFWEWIRRRAEGFLEACRRDEELSDELRCSMGFEVQDEWFGEEEARLTGRKFYPIPPNKKPRFASPPKPECWLVFEHTTVGSRDLEREDREFDGRRLYPRLRADSDPWFDYAWKSIPEEQKKMGGGSEAAARVPEARIFSIAIDPSHRQ